MDSGVRSLVNASPASRLSQVHLGKDIQLMKMAMESQSQIVQEVLEILPAGGPTGPAYLGANLDIYL